MCTGTLVHSEQKVRLSPTHGEYWKVLGDLQRVGHDKHCSPRHRIPFNSWNEVEKRVCMTRWVTCGWPDLLGPDKGR
jgi:hypothetical protein